MRERVRISIAGGSGYAGGELIRLLHFHPHVEIVQVTSERMAGKSVAKAHPNLRKVVPYSFCRIADLEPCDVLFSCLPHGRSMATIEDFRQIAPRIIDLSADFRLNDAKAYERWYGKPHQRSDLLGEFVYGICELHRDAMVSAKAVSSAGCNATAAILGLYPLYRAGVVERDRTIVEVKVGSSEGGASSSDASHHPERSGCVRSFSPTGHRHSAEVIQELGGGEDMRIGISVTSIEMVRGVLATCHVELKEDLTEKDIWKIYRSAYGDEPFIRLVKERDGLYRYPEPKLLAGTNYCDIGFERDSTTQRLVVISAIDNLMKGAAGQAVQALNIMHAFDERSGLTFPGLHP